MEKVDNIKIKESVYTEKLENGLKIIIIPKKNTLKKYIILGTHFGSIDNRFVMPKTKEEVFIPDGVAHFLEHKLFEQPDGTNSLDTLMALGMEANAYTTNDHTAYLYQCTDDFYKGLDELMDYVQTPYFTDENVEKEKGIIAQEISMYDDDPGFQVYINTMECMYKNNPVKLDIAGTAESISKITPDVLYKCYNTFYNMGNMVMVVCGDFEPEKLVKEIRKRIKNNQYDQGEIERIYPEESKEIAKKSNTVKMEVSTPLFMIGIKDNSNNQTVKTHIAVEIILNMLIGQSSELYKDLYDKGLLLSEPELDYEFSKEYSHILIGGQSKNPDKIFELLNDKISEFINNGICLEDFERIKKKIYGQYVTEYNSVSNIARMFLNDNFRNVNSFDYINECPNIDLEFTKKILSEIFKNENIVISIVEPK
ncbi:MAG TPA: pitrilysin family protein [Clostridia bacterium]|nr:pitrilysin family protein [Clostridia bacterium]